MLMAGRTWKELIFYQRTAVSSAAGDKRMSEVNKSVLVGYSAQQMFALVDQVENYPDFLPWCSAAEVDYRDAQKTRATIHIDYRGIRQSFTTENRKESPQAIHMKLVRGPFRTLDGSWRFTDLSGQGCKIEFTLHYEFSSRLLDKLVGPVFGYIANNIVDGFVRRAEQVYAAS
jgi:ribosome-associated toxin RatA of RatAB toxin-antitoxin module